MDTDSAEQQLSTLLKSIAVTVLLFSSMACQARLGAESPRAAFKLVENGNLQKMNVMYESYDIGLGYRRRYLVEQENVKNYSARELHRLPIYRKLDVVKRVSSLLYAADRYPYHGKLQWIVGNNPLTIAIGEAQSAGFKNDPSRRYPFVGSGDGEEPVSQLIIFPRGAWNKLERAKSSDSNALMEYVTKDMAPGTRLNDVLLSLSE